MSTETFLQRKMLKRNNNGSAYIYINKDIRRYLLISVHSMYDFLSKMRWFFVGAMLACCKGKSKKGEATNRWKQFTEKSPGPGKEKFARCVKTFRCSKKRGTPLKIKKS